MTSIIKDIETVYMYPTANEMEFSQDGDPQIVPIYLRVEIDANTRDDWHISEIYMLEEESSYSRDGIIRADESMVCLKGEFKAYAINFIRSMKGEFLQNAVNLEIPDDGESVGYDRLRADELVECGRRMWL